MRRTASQERRWAHSLAGASLIACAGLCQPAAAQVLEIGDNGAVTVHDRPEVTLSTGVTPILQPPAHRRKAIRATPVSAADLSDAATGADLSPDLVEAVAWRESRLNPAAVSPAGAIGAMQLMPATARDLRVDPHDARQNLKGGAAYLQAMIKRYDGDVVKALAAYNAGPKAVDRYGGVPPYKETRGYIADILDRLSQRAAGAPTR